MNKKDGEFKLKRKVAYIYYLTNLKKEDGGALNLYASENKSPTEISKKIYRSAPVTKSLLERMMQVDLIVKVDNKYNFSNPILKQWLKLVFLGVEFDYVPSDRELKQIEEVLDEKQ